MYLMTNSSKSIILALINAHHTQHVGAQTDLCSIQQQNHNILRGIVPFASVLDNNTCGLSLRSGCRHHQTLNRIDFSLLAS